MFGFNPRYSDIDSTKELMNNNSKKLAEAEEIMRNLVDGIDHWNASIQTIMGKQPDYNWPALNEAKKFLENK